VCLLLLRGPQTPGELRSRSNRLYEFTDVAQVEDCIKQLLHREKPILEQLAREPGRRECRYTELFSASSVSDASAAPSALASAVHSEHAHAGDERAALTLRVTQLEQQVAALSHKLDELIASLGA
ncbi:MAG: DUF480 domain-containing protein, partial [Shewanella sp.]